MATTSLDAINVQEVKAYHGFEGTDKDTQIKLMLPLVADFIESYCNQDFQSTTRTAEKPFILKQADSFFTEFSPVASISSLTEGGTALVEDTNFYVDKRTGRVEKIATGIDITVNQPNPVFWSTVRNTIIITYIGGVALSTVQDIVMAFYEIVGILTGIKIKTFINNEGEESLPTIIGSLPKYVMMILNKHVRRPV